MLSCMHEIDQQRDFMLRDECGNGKTFAVSCTGLIFGTNLAFYLRSPSQYEYNIAILTTILTPTALRSDVFQARNDAQRVTQNRLASEKLLIVSHVL